MKQPRHPLPASVTPRQRPANSNSAPDLEPDAYENGTRNPLPASPAQSYRENSYRADDDIESQAYSHPAPAKTPPTLMIRTDLPDRLPVIRAEVDLLRTYIGQLIHGIVANDNE